MSAERNHRRLVGNASRVSVDAALMLSVQAFEKSTLHAGY